MIGSVEVWLTFADETPDDAERVEEVPEEQTKRGLKRSA